MELNELDSVKSDLLAVEHSKKVIQNTIGFLGDANFAGRHAPDLAEALKWLKDVLAQADDAQYKLLIRKAELSGTDLFGRDLPTGEGVSNAK
jgi:hypothetical protein